MMKKLLLLLALGISTATYAENVPAPFWYNISERILTETQQFFAPSATIGKSKVKHNRIKANPLKCQPKKVSIPAIISVQRIGVEKQQEPALGMEAAARPM